MGVSKISVAAAWKEFAQEVLPEVPIESSQYTECMKCFYAGFGASILSLSRIVDSVGEGEGVHALSDLLVEIEQYIGGDVASWA